MADCGRRVCPLGPYELGAWFDAIATQFNDAAGSRLLSGPLVWMRGRSGLEEYTPLVVRVSDLGVTTEVELYFLQA